MEEGIRYIITKGTKDGSIQKGDKVYMYSDVLCETTSTDFIIPISEKVLRSLEYDVDLDYYETRILKFKKLLKEAIQSYRSALYEKNNKPDKSNKS